MPHTPTPINVRLRGDQTKGRLAVMENRVAAGFAGPPLHVHPDFDETFYVLEGELTFQVGDERQGIDPPDWALRPLPEVRTVGPSIGS
jgi:quercetin dioxygenase-like cupin family protein